MISNLVHKIALEGFKKEKIERLEENNLLQRIKDIGSQIWIDSGDREKVKSLWKKECSALTTNNTLANQVVQTGIMDEEIKKAAKILREQVPGITPQELIFEIGFIVNCKIALRLVSAFNTKVSVELHPAWARDKEKSVTYGKRYFAVCPEHFIIKIPLTPEGYLAVRELKKDTIPINFTLGFSVRQNYLATLLSHPDYYNIFLGRLNAVVIDNKMGDGKNVGELVTLNTQKMLNTLRANNPSIKSKLIAASIRNGKQVESLAGVDVLTIPPQALQEFTASGVNPSALKNNLETDFPVGIEESHLERFKILWELDPKFKAFTAKLLQMDLDSLTGEKLVSLCEENRIDLFHRFSESELNSIKKQGKIPKISDWKEDVALDDLMTLSALQSFSKDQEELDQRISSLCN